MAMRIDTMATTSQEHESLRNVWGALVALLGLCSSKGTMVCRMHLAACQQGLHASLLLRSKEILGLRTWQLRTAPYFNCLSKLCIVGMGCAVGAMSASCSPARLSKPSYTIALLLRCDQSAVPPVFMDAHWAATGSLVLDLGAAEGYICLQVSVSSTALLPALEVLIPRLTIGSWASSRGQLGLAAASLRAITAAITDDAANVEAFLNTNPLKPLVRALSLPANEEAPVCAMRCVQALCNASRVAQANLHEHKAVNVLTELVQMPPGGFPAKQNDLKQVALGSLASLVDGFPDAQAEACQGAHSCFFVLLLRLHVAQSGL
jgi:hypothetical protein